VRVRRKVEKRTRGGDESRNGRLKPKTQQPQDVECQECSRSNVGKDPGQKDTGGNSGRGE